MSIISFCLRLQLVNCRKMTPQTRFTARICTSNMIAALLHKKSFQKLLMEMVHWKVIRMYLHVWNPLVVHLMFHFLKLKMDSMRSGLLQLFRQHLELSWYACKCRLLNMFSAPISQQT